MIAAITKARNPLVKKARPHDTPEIRRKKFLFNNRTSVKAKKNAVIEAVMNMENILSRTQKVPIAKTSRHVKKTEDAIIAVVMSLVNLCTRKNNIVADIPTASAEGSRIAKAFSPINLILIELSQYPRIGFSKYLSPLSRGTTQSPVSTISLLISA